MPSGSKGDRVRRRVGGHRDRATHGPVGLTRHLRHDGASHRYRHGFNLSLPCCRPCVHRDDGWLYSPIVPANFRHASAISPHDLREVCLESRPSETSEGVGDAGRTDAPQPRVRSGSKQMHTSIHSGSTRNHPASPHAMVLRLIRALPGEPCSVATVALG